MIGLLPGIFLATLLDGHNEAIALAVHSFDHLLLTTIVTQGLTRLSNTAGEGPVADEPLWPELLKDLVPWHNSVAMLDEVCEHTQHLAFQPHRRASTA